MALSDPCTITINAVQESLPRIKTEGLRSTYQSQDGNLEMIFSHQVNDKRKRHMVRINQRTIAADPLTSVNEYKEVGVYLVIDEPNYGFTDQEIVDLVEGLFSKLSYDTYGVIVNMLGLNH